MVKYLGLVVSLSGLLGLFLEPLALYEGVVQLGVGVAKLSLAHK